MSLPIAPSKGVQANTNNIQTGLYSRPSTSEGDGAKRNNSSSNKTSPPTSTIVTSKEWKLPPRPKPGRKPASESQNGSAGSKKRNNTTAATNGTNKKTKTATTKNMSSDDLRHALKQAQDENENLLKHIKQLEAELEGYRSKIDSRLLKNEPQEQQQQTPQENDGNGSECHLCNSGGSCVCDHLGLKNSSSGDKTLTNGPELINLDEYDYFTPLQAVPLRRREDPKNSSSAPKFLNKFKRLDDSKKNGQDHTPRYSKPITAATVTASPMSTNYINNNSNNPNSISPELTNDTNDNTNEHTHDHINGHNYEPEEDEADDDMFFSAAKSSATIDPCGFCSTGTPCLCAETARAEEEEHNKKKKSCSMSLSSTPGSCFRCQSDPQSTLFCATLSSRGKKQNSIALGVNTVSCNEAFQTLSKHEEFKNWDMNKLVERLSTDGFRVNTDSITRTLKEMSFK